MSASDRFRDTFRLWYGGCVPPNFMYMESLSTGQTYRMYWPDVYHMVMTAKIDHGTVHGEWYFKNKGSEGKALAFSATS